MPEFINKNSNFLPQTNKKGNSHKNKKITDENQLLVSAVSLKNTATKNKKTTKTIDTDNDTILKNPVARPIWLSISEAAKIGGVNTKTIRRALQSGKIKYKIYKNRYLIGLRSLVLYLNSNTKLKNKLNFNGIGQYIKGWRK